MKEIKVQITGYKRAINGVKPNQYTEFTVRPIEIVPEFDFSKNYKLVEAVPEDNFKTASFKNNPLVYLSLDEKIEFAKYLEHAPKMIFSTSALPGFKGGKIPNKIINSTTYGVFKKARVQFNGNATILEIGDFKTVVKCHEDDTFNEVIGLGLALSRYYTKQKTTKKEIKLLEKMLDYKMLAEYCFHKYFNHDDKRIDKCVEDIFDTRNKWVDLCLEK